MTQRSIVLVLVSAVIGPLVGALAVLGFALVHGLATRAELGPIGPVWHYFVIGGYLLGLIPALITGVLAAAIGGRLPRAGQRIAAATIIGAVASSAVILMLIPLLPGSGRPPVGWQIVSLLGFAGALAGMVCAAVAEISRLPAPQSS